MLLVSPKKAWYGDVAKLNCDPSQNLISNGMDKKLEEIYDASIDALKSRFQKAKRTRESIM